MRADIVPASELMAAGRRLDAKYHIPSPALFDQQERDLRKRLQYTLASLEKIRKERIAVAARVAARRKKAEELGEKR
jgi:hypothetical protein